MNRNLWYGFLDAGVRSSPVIIDLALTTDKPDTVYVFNHNRNKILEYKRDIIDSKLREFNADETALISVLTAAYEQAREAFFPKYIKTPPLDFSLDQGAANHKARTDDDPLGEDNYSDFNDFDVAEEEDAN